MIHVDIDSLTNKFYQYGLGVGTLTAQEKLLFVSLDAWQRNELLNSLEAGRSAKTEMESSK